MYQRESTARHSSTQKQLKLNRNLGKKNQFPVLSRSIFFCLIETHLHPVKKKKREKSNRRGSLSASYDARPSRDHLATESVRVKLSFLSAAVRPVARLTQSPVLTVALVHQLDKVGAQNASLLLIFSYVAKLKPLESYLHIKTTLTYSYIVPGITGTTPGGQTEPTHASLVSHGTRDA